MNCHSSFLGMAAPEPSSITVRPLSQIREWEIYGIEKLLPLGTQFPVCVGVCCYFNAVRKSGEMFPASCLIGDWPTVQPPLDVDVLLLRRHSGPGSVPGWRQFSSVSAEAPNSGELDRTEASGLSQRKRLKVAIVGRPNAGKSTLINRILKLNVCDVSPKTHTTRRPLKTALTHGDTQIVFMDTPGLVTKREFSRFELSNTFLSWRENVFREADIVGIIHEVTSPKDIFRLHVNLVQSINNIPEPLPMFIILNKIDLVIDKAGVSKAIAAVMQTADKDELAPKLPNVWKKFSNIFLISALKNIGVEEVVNYLMEQAKPGDWLFQPSVVCNKPLHVLVTDLLRAKVMDVLPEEVPYKCRFEVEYLKENDLGEIICVALIKLQRDRHLKILVQKRKNALRTLSKKLESDLYHIIGKVFRIRIVARSAQKESRSK